MVIDNYSPNINRKRIENVSKHSIKFKEEIFDFEDPISLSEVGLPTEEDLVLSVHGYSLNDSEFEYNTEVDSHDADTSSKTRQYFNNIIGREESDSADDDADSNEKNISDLVQNYFETNFDKCTFS